MSIFILPKELVINGGFVNAVGDEVVTGRGSTGDKLNSALNLGNSPGGSKPAGGTSEAKIYEDLEAARNMVATQVKAVNELGIIYNEYSKTLSNLESLCANRPKNWVGKILTELEKVNFYTSGKGSKTATIIGSILSGGVSGIIVAVKERKEAKSICEDLKNKSGKFHSAKNKMKAAVDEAKALLDTYQSDMAEIEKAILEYERKTAENKEALMLAETAGERELLEKQIEAEAERARLEIEKTKAKQKPFIYIGIGALLLIGIGLFLFRNKM